MARSQEYSLRPPSEEQQRKKRKRLGSEKLERFVLAFSLLLIAAGVKYYISETGVDAGRGKTLTLVPGLPSEMKPEQYDPSKELRIAVAEPTSEGNLKPFVIVLRGPWNFGVSEIDSVAMALGPPMRRGSGYLLYHLGEGKIRVVILFSAGRLDTIVLSPVACPPGATPCEPPYTWGLNERQIQSEGLQLEPGEDQSSGKCGVFTAGSRGFYYPACPIQGWPRQASISGVHVQRLTKEIQNPPFVRGISTPDKGTEEPDRLPPHEYQKLLEQYQEALRLKAKALGSEHTSVLFLRFEIGRMQAEAGHVNDGRKVMAASIQGLLPKLGRDHPDLQGMRAWAGGSKPAAP